MRVFVTGGTGLLGNTVIRKLCAAGNEVVALVRGEPDPEVFEGLNISLIHAELIRQDSEPDSDEQNDHGAEGADADELEQAIALCDAVVHSAAMIHLGWHRLAESMRVNREGTRRIVDACLAHGKKLAVIGTVNAMAVGSLRVVADEDTPLGHAGGQIECAYVQSKRAQINVVRDAVADGLNAVILHPGFMLGPWDWKPSSGRMMLEVGKAWKPIAPSGGCSVCDSRDVADGVIAALLADTPSGREFILAGNNMTYKDLWCEMAQRMGTRPPIRAAGPGMEYLAGIAGDLLARITGNEPDFNSAGVAMSGQYHWYTSHRAQVELGYHTRDAQETLDDAAEWIQQRFVLPARAAAS